MEEELREATWARVFGFLLIGPSAVLLSSGIWGENKAAGIFYGLLGGVLGTVIVVRGNSQAREAYRHLFDAVNSYNEQGNHPGKDGVTSSAESVPDEKGEGTFPPGLPREDQP